MTARATFTKAILKRAIEAAREVDAMAIVKVGVDGSIFILPYVADPLIKQASDVEDFFSRHDDD